MALTGQDFSAWWGSTLSTYRDNLISQKYNAAFQVYVGSGGDLQYWNSDDVRAKIAADVDLMMSGLIGTAAGEFRDGILYKVFDFITREGRVSGVVIQSGQAVLVSAVTHIGATTEDGAQSGTARIE